MAGRDWIAKTVIACNKRDAFVQGSEATKQSICPRVERWIASRSLSSGAHSRDPLARNDGEARYIFINAWRSILPVPVFGNSAMKVISRGYL
jgi:hypothetical protein